MRSPLREYEQVCIGEDCSVAEAEAIVAAQPPGVPALKWTSRQTLVTAQYVGILAATDVRLEILPKIKGLEEGATRGVLVRMIAASLDISLHVSDITGHDTHENDLLDVLIGLFVERLKDQMRGGLSRSYERRSEDLSCLRGKLDLVRQLTVHAANPQKLACHFDELTADTALNRRLFCALRFLLHLSKCESTKRAIARLLPSFQEVHSLTAAESLQERIVLTRLNQPWHPVETLASLFLSGLSQTSQSGDGTGFSLLFDMNLLFEKYVAFLVKGHCRRNGLSCRTQGPEKALVADDSGGGLFYTKPDLYVSRDGRVIVLDTKWKELESGAPSLKVSMGDVYQMHAYATTYAADSMVLIYPLQPSMPKTSGHREWSLGSAKIPLHIVSIDVAQPGEIDTLLADLFA